MRRIKLEQTHSPKSGSICVIDFRVMLYEVWAESCTVADAYDYWTRRLLRGPDMLPHIANRLDVVLDDSKAEYGYWRNLIYAEYKLRRKANSHTIGASQSTRLSYVDVRNAGYEAVTALKLPYFAQSGFEADDIAGAVFRIKCSAKPESLLANKTVYYSTVDSDWLQLVDDTTHQLWANTHDSCTQDRLRAEAQVRKYCQDVFRFSASTPADIARLKATRGDSSDNLPPGCGARLVDLRNADSEHKLSESLLGRLKQTLEL